MRTTSIPQPHTAPIVKKFRHVPSYSLNEGLAKNIGVSLASRAAGKAVGRAMGVSNRFGLRGAGVVGGALGQALIDRHEAKKQGVKPPPFVSVKNFKNLKKSAVGSVKSLAKTAVVKGALSAATIGTGGFGGVAAVLGGRMVLDRGINKTLDHVKKKIAIRKQAKMERKADNRDNHSASFMNNHLTNANTSNTSNNSNSPSISSALSTKNSALAQIKSGQIHSQGTMDLKTGKSNKCPIGTRNKDGQCVMS